MSAVRVLRELSHWGAEVFTLRLASFTSPDVDSCLWKVMGQ